MPVDKKKNRGDGRDEKGKFAEGNELWQLAKNQGKPLAFESPEDMWQRACKYFEWVEENPLLEDVVFNHRDFGIIHGEIKKKRPFTLFGLCIHMGVRSKYITEFDLTSKPEYADVITRIREIIYNQKFEGAASGFFNANIIARDLGLADKSEFKGKVKTGLDAYSEEELKDRLDQLNSFEDDLD